MCFQPSWVSFVLMKMYVYYACNSDSNCLFDETWNILLHPSCAMGCTFCATGTMGIRGNLCSGEILEQVVHASRILANDSTKGTNKTKPELIRNIVFMGMGEPLNNYANVLTTCKALIDRRLWNLAHNRVTVSTVGVTSRMRDLTRDLPEVNLALSLHAPNQAMREAIVPSAKGTPIESLIDALDEHMMAFAKRKQSENPQESSNSQDHSDETFNSEERITASKKKRAMIEYVMCKWCVTVFFASVGTELVLSLILSLYFYSLYMYRDEIQWMETHQQSKQLISLGNSAKDGSS